MYRTKRGDGFYAYVQAVRNREDTGIARWLVCCIDKYKSNSYQMYYLIYISTAEKGVGEGEMHDILTASVKNNERNDLSGLLVYNDGAFIQMLEGKKEEVTSTFDKIKADKRHFEVKVLSQGASDKRYFPNWRMALEVTHEKTFRELEAFENLEEANDFLDGITDNQSGIRLLKYFYESIGAKKYN